MAITHVAADYLFSDMLVKEPEKEKGKERDVRVNLSVDQLISGIAVGLPLMLITLAFAQEVNIGVQINCFSPSSFSWPQAMYINSYCWAAIQSQNTDGLPLWLHKFFPYILLLAAVLVYLPVLFWRLTAAQILSPDLSFIMNELDRSYNRAVNLAKCQHAANKSEKDETRSSLEEQRESCYRYPLVSTYLETKSDSKKVLVQYMLCRLLMVVALLLACLYLCYYIRLSAADEFLCDIRSGVLLNNSRIPEAVQCKLVAVGVFRILCYVNLVVYVLLAPVCVYATLVPLRTSAEFLKPYEMLPTHDDMEFGPRRWDDLAIYLLFLQENLNQLKSYKCLKVLAVLKNRFGYDDIMELLWALAKGKGDEQDGKKKKNPQNPDDKTTNPKNQTNQQNCNEKKELVPLLAMETSGTVGDETVVDHSDV